MFLIRTIFWVSLVILLLPVGGSNSSNLLGATKHAMNDMDQFCARNVDICNISTEAWKSLKYKAAYSFDALASMAKDIKQAGNQDYSPVYEVKPGNWQQNTPGGRLYTSSTNTQNTLTSSDLQPGWSFDSKNKAGQPAI